MEDSNIGSASSPSQLLNMQVQIGDGRKDILIIKMQDDPKTLAREFAIKHSIDRVLESHLVTLIQVHKQQKLQELEAAQLQSQIQANKASQRRATRTKTTIQKLAQSLKKASKPTKSIKTMTNINSKLQIKNFGVSLYQKDLRWKQSQQKKIEQMKQKEDQKLRTSTLTFKPLINEYSNMLASRTFQAPERHLLRKGQERNQRIEQLQHQGIRKEMSECSFQPNSHKRFNQSSSTNLGATLHEEASSRKQKREVQSQLEFESKFNFQPNSQFRKIRQSAKQQEELADRLINFKKQKQEKLKKEQCQKRDSQLCDNGRPFFVPKTNNVRNINSKVYSKVYYSAKRQIENQNPSVCSGRPQVNGKSIRIYDQLRGKQYAKLFSVLDSDCDGIISSEKINIDNFDIKLLTVLTPLFAKLDQGVKMDLNSFIGFIQDLWDSLSVDQRALIMKRESKSVDLQNFNNQLVSEKSTTLAMKKRGSVKSDVYERAINSKMIEDMKKQKQRELLEIESNKQCTFKPNLTKKL